MTSQTPIRKVLIPTFGDVSVLKIVDDKISPPVTGEVQVAPLYSGFSGADVNMRKGTYPMQNKAPLTPGYCLVGRVVANALSKTSSAARFPTGTLVACLTVYDAQTTLVNVPEKYLVAVPEGLDAASATTLVLDWSTAYGMVHRAAQVSKGQRVFIHGLSGAVGNALVQLCRLQGAEVYGTASARNHDALQKQGATPFVYTDKKWIATVKELGGVHAVFDALGFESWDESYSILSESESSILVGYGGNAESLGAPETSATSRSVIGPTLKLLSRGAKFWQKKKTTFYWISRDQSTFKPELDTLFKMAQDGKLAIGIKKIWEMEDIQEAHRSWGSGQGMGSILVKISDDEQKS
jgi:NADPH:quinone reductase-like Zn-dependent oxidoreductase